MRQVPYLQRLKRIVSGAGSSDVTKGNLGNRMWVTTACSSSSSSSSKTTPETKRYQHCMRCPCNISLMFMHESPSYNITPQLYAVTIGIVGHSRGAGSMLPPGVHRSISIANNFLFIYTNIINFHVHTCNMVTEQKIVVVQTKSKHW